MRLMLEKRLETSTTMLVMTPVLSVVVIMVLGVIIFDGLGYDGQQAVWELFFTPVLDLYKWRDVASKAAPLILIALGLSLGNQAKIWNIGAEGQYIVGAIGAAGIAYVTQGLSGIWIIPLMIGAGMICGALYAAIPAWLKTRFGVSEVLSSLMFVYVSLQILSYLITGPWKDPDGHNFPQTAQLTDAQLLPHELGTSGIPPGLLVAFIAAIIFYVIVSKTVFGFSIRAIGEAPHAARYGGFSANEIVWTTLMISGAMAGLAGVLELMQLTKLNLGYPSGYGFTAIIVSLLGRSHPIGVFIAGIVLAVTYVGGQVAQTVVHVPNATAGLFQAMLLFAILASDLLVRYRIKIKWSSAARDGAHA
jgi:general nucleoside transport system permease protein